MILNINNMDCEVNFIYNPAIPLIPDEPEIEPEPENIIIDKILDRNKKVITVDQDILESIKKECIIYAKNILSGLNNN